MYALGMMVGGLVPTFLVSRLLLWLTRSWNGGVTRLIIAHVFSWLIAAFIGGMGMADGGAFAGAEAAALYAIPQAVWFLFDIVRQRIKTHRPVKGTQISN